MDMKENQNAAKFSPGTKIKASDDDYIIKQGKNDVISLKIYTGEKFTFKTFTDAFNKVADLQNRTDEGLRKVKVIFLNGSTITFDLAKAEKDTAEFERIKALDSNLGKAPAKKAKKLTTGFIIEEYSIGEKWHLSGTNEKGEPLVYATREEAETEKNNKIKEWADEGMDFDPADFRVISLDEFENKVKDVMKEYGLGPKAAREFLYSGQRLGKPGNKASTARYEVKALQGTASELFDNLADARKAIGWTEARGTKRPYIITRLSDGAIMQENGMFKMGKNKAGGKKPAKNRTSAIINKNIFPAMDALDDAKIPMINHGFGLFHVKDKDLENARAALKKAGIPFRETDMTLQGEYKPKHMIIIEKKPVAARNKAEAQAITVDFVKERTSIDYANHWEPFDETKGGYTEADPSKPETWAKIDTVIPMTMNTDEFANMLGKVHGGTWELTYKDETDDPDMIVSFERKRAANKAEKVLICSFCGGKLGAIERDEKNDITWRTCLKCGYEWNKAHWQWLEEKEKSKNNKTEAGTVTIGSGDYTVNQLKDGFRVNMPAGGSMTFKTLSEALVFIYRDRAIYGKVGKITMFMADGTTKTFDTNKTKKNRAPSKNPKIQSFYNEKVAPIKAQQDELISGRMLTGKDKMKANKLWIDIMVPLELGVLDEGVKKATDEYTRFIRQKGPYLVDK